MDQWIKTAMNFEH